MAEGGRVLAGDEVVEAGFTVPFFAGALVGSKHLLVRAVVDSGHRIVGVGTGFTSRIA